MRAIKLKTEFMKDPVGLDVSKPRLSWICEGGIRQTAYEIRAFLNKGEGWDSGKIESADMAAFISRPLRSRERVRWQVRLWDEKGEEGPWSEEAFFEMGLLSQNEYVAKWINPELSLDSEKHQPASYLRKIFQVDEIPDSSRLYITSHGLYEAHINGRRVGDFVLAPGVSSYEKRQHIQTYDVTALLQPGENEALVLLGDGWYRSCSGVDGERNIYGKEIALFFQLEADGHSICLSDESWEATQEGPVRMNDMQHGEIVDARLENFREWHSVRVEDFGTANLCASNCVPIREHERFSASMFTAPNGDTLLDFGQNLAGYVEFMLNANEGDTITLTCGEALDEYGNFTQENFQDHKRHREGGARQQIVYTCKDGANHYKTRFSIWGFRYVKVETEIDLSDASFTAIAVYSDMERLGWFDCDHPLVNQLVENTLWSMKSNFCDVPTDCPTRERAAWTGDVGVFIETGLYLANCYPIVRKWLGECRLNQYPDGKVANIAPKNKTPGFTADLLAGSVGWGDATILVPWALYTRTGDHRFLEENLDMMRRWYAYLESRAGDKQSSIDMGAIPEQYRAMLKNMPPEKLKEMVKKFASPKSSDNPFSAYAIETGTDYGEWCEPDVDSISNMGKPQAKVATAYYAMSGRLLSKIFAILGDDESAAQYAEISEGAKKAFCHMAAPEGKINSDRQAEFVRAIDFDLLDEAGKRMAAAALNDLVIQCDYHLNTGFLSTPALCPVLAAYGHEETAYRLLLQDTMPSWLYEIKRGATTIWEEWDGVNEQGVVKASLNHYSKGAICGWLFSGVCGIHVEGPEITIQPQPNRLLGRAEARYFSPVGEVVSGWRCDADGSVQYHIEIPTNTQATFVYPTGQQRKLGPGKYSL